MSAVAETPDDASKWAVVAGVAGSGAPGPAEMGADLARTDVPVGRARWRPRTGAPSPCPAVAAR